MARVSIRELRNSGGDVVRRAADGETLTITSGGTPVAQLRPLPATPLRAEQLLARWRRLPPLSAEALRADLDAALDARL